MFYFTLAASFSLLFLIIIADITQDSKNRVLFNAFIKNYGKKYTSKAKYEERFKIFVNNSARIADFKKWGQDTAKYGVTQFSDLTETEFKQMYGKVNPSLRKGNLPITNENLNIKVKMIFDWRDQNVVTKVKNQGVCASSWAFATVANIESQYAIKYKKLISLSEQELIDCDRAIDNGCKEGFMTNGYDAVIKLGGLENQLTYPYKGTNNSCKFRKSKAVVKITGRVKLPQDEKKMAAWILKFGPVVIAINSADMQFYQSGIANTRPYLCSKGEKDINHGLLVVGFGSGMGIPYWILKNSWGEDFGENGYYRIHRGSNACGITTLPPTTVFV